MPLLRDQLGHCSLAITDRYLGDIAPGEVISAARSRLGGAWTNRRLMNRTMHAGVCMSGMAARSTTLGKNFLTSWE